MRGFQKGITLDDKTSRSVNLVGLQNRVAKKFAKFLHLSWDSIQHLGVGPLEVPEKFSVVVVGGWVYSWILESISLLS